MDQVQINVLIVQMFILILKMDIAQNKIHLVSLDSTTKMLRAKIALLIVQAAHLLIAAIVAYLDSNYQPLELIMKLLAFAIRYVEMERDFKFNAMMEIKKMVMVAQVLVKYKMDTVVKVPVRSDQVHALKNHIQKHK